MSADGDIVREALKTHDLTAGATSIDAEHDPACRYCAALAALARLETTIKDLSNTAKKMREGLNVAEAQRDALADEVRRLSSGSEIPSLRAMVESQRELLEVYRSALADIKASKRTSKPRWWAVERARAALAEAGLE